MAFADQAASCRQMGSPLTANVCEHLGAALQPDQGPVAQRVLNWPGEASSRADSVPLRLAGALHAVILAEKAPELAAAYKKSDPSTELLLATIAAHQDFILDWLDSPPQTNEVGRSAAIIGATRFVSTQCGLPIEALELGASAGLNLNFHRYHLGDIGPGNPAVSLSPEWQGEMPDGSPDIISVEGVDLRPLDARRDGMRLLAYCWADQHDRLSRLRAALDMAKQHPPHVTAGDAADWLEQRLSQRRPSRLRFVYHTIAWQYFPASVQERCEAAMQQAGAAATEHEALAHFSMEADGSADGAGMTLRLWDGQLRIWQLGRADFHGRWIKWSPVQRR